MARNGNRPGEGAANSVGIDNATEFNRLAPTAQDRAGRSPRRAVAAARPARAVPPAHKCPDPAARPNAIAVFRTRAEARALLWQAGEIDLHDAVDGLQTDAIRDGLVASIGQDRVQAVLSTAFGAVRGDIRDTVSQVPDMVPAPAVVAPEDEDTFARACRAADEKARRQPPDPPTERARRMLAGDVSLARAYGQMQADFFHGRAANTTLMAAEYLVREGDAGRLRNWIDRHSAPERETILQYLERRKRTRAT